MVEQHEIRLNSWDDFPGILDELAELRPEFRAPVFRGMANSEWQLETTLERSLDASGTETLLSYYEKITRTKPAVESLTDRKWDDIPQPPDFENWLKERRNTWIDLILPDKPAIYEYLIYLRHHGFPSPVLDWTTSPYIAALFAFDDMDRRAGNVAIYAYAQNRNRAIGADAHLFTIGRYLRTHRRHYLQQSEYSLCLRLRAQEDFVDYEFLPHKEVLYQKRNSDLFKRIVIPATERKRALMQLDSMNINPHSIYGSEESLIRTIARRELLFERR